MELRRFGRTNHQTSVLVYGAAGLGGVSQQVADESLALAMDAGINHYDTAASYGHAEQVMGDFVARTRADIFLATKTTERTEEAAWAEITRSMELLKTDHVDLLQVHAVCNDDDLEKVFAKGGPIAAFERARDEGLTRWIGITGHTEAAPRVHAEALRRFDFDSVLCPMNYQLHQDPVFADGWNELLELVEQRDVGLRTIKAIARRPWLEDDHRYATWYEPFDDQTHVTAAVSWVLGSFPQIAGLATAGESTLLPLAYQAEQNRMSVDEAAEVLAAVDDYRTIFV
ncbi:aldo/keto reductase [Aestuariimicrobium ganziense]|uniref:aldo/keto reductase n=1 Tax=Aestuariimicrobium ganziense TaxID=2773677 RepID=UPI001944A2FB|nr:aldo/keto reductase [Aestuariimicrobium ganziense]